jgi:hypothetical protein
MNDLDALEKFQMWYFEPIEKLYDLPNGRGGFIAFIVGITLYERLIVARIKHERKGLSEEIIEEKDIKSAMQKDLGLTSHELSIFWDLFRNGLLHQAMPKKGKTAYKFNHTFSGYPKFLDKDGGKCICIDPWKFAFRIIDEFKQNPHLISESESFPLPEIIPETP